MGFWSRLREFFGAFFGKFGGLVGHIGIGTIVLVIIYMVIALVPFRLVDEYLLDLYRAKKHHNWRYWAIWVLRHLVLMPLAWLFFTAIWYGLHGDFWGALLGIVLPLLCRSIAERIWG